MYNNNKNNNKNNNNNNNNILKWGLRVGAIGILSMFTRRVYKKSLERQALKVKIPIKSIEDKRNYRIIELSNEMRCILVSDKDTDKAACAIDVNVGHFSDPKELPGLAHFLEHMLFLGTEKYPDESSYKKFLNEHGGFSNAYTSMEHTNFHFAVGRDHLYDALDRLSQFFISPLFTESATDRELQAVNNEHEKNINNDSRRRFQLYKHHSINEHPMSKFGTGNIDTLKNIPESNNINVRDELLKFHHEYYSSNIMTLAVVGKESLDVLQNWIIKLFSIVPNHKIQRPSFVHISHPYINMIGLKYEVVPVKDQRTMRISFNLPSLDNDYEYHPASILSHLLGHEGVGSLYGALKSKNWIFSLVAGNSYSTESFASFYVDVTLTEDGFKHIDDIIRIVFAYIELLKAMNNDIMQIYAQEMIELAEIGFRFKGKESPYRYVQYLSSALHFGKRIDILSRPYLFDFSYEKVKNYMNYLNPENFFVHVVSKDFEGKTNNTEPIYGTQFNVGGIDENLINDLRNIANGNLINVIDVNDNNFNEIKTAAKIIGASINNDVKIPLKLNYKNHQNIMDKNEWIDIALLQFLPPKNPYISTHFDLVPEQPGSSWDAKPLRNLKTNSDYIRDYIQPPIPHILIENEYLRCWHIGDSKFKKPALHVSLACWTASDVLIHSPRTSVLCRLLTSLFRDFMAVNIYDADLAGLWYSISMSSYTGPKFTFGGFHEKLNVLISLILNDFREFYKYIDEKKFELRREKLIRSYRGTYKDQPYHQGNSDQRILLITNQWSVDEYLNIIENITLNEWKLFCEDILERGFLEMFIHGNITRDDAKLLANSISNIFQFDEKKNVNLLEITFPYRVELPKNTVTYYRRENSNKSDTNSACIVRYELMNVLSDDHKAMAIVDLFAQFLNEPAFNQLRTTEQLGYIVWTQSTQAQGVLALQFTIQSSDYSPDYLETRIEAFLKHFCENILPKTSKNDFDRLQINSAEQMLTKAKTLRQQHDRYVGQINGQTYDFTSLSAVVEEFLHLDLNCLIEFYETYLKIGAPLRKKICTQIFAQQHLPIPDQPTMTSMDEIAIKRKDDSKNNNEENNNKDDSKNKIEENNNKDDSKNKIEENNNKDEETKTDLPIAIRDTSKVDIIDNQFKTLSKYRQTKSLHPLHLKVKGQKLLETLRDHSKQFN